MFELPADNGGKQVALFVFIDALGWRLFRRHQQLLLEDELQMARPLESILGYSCACDPTILTGRMPQDHGHFSFFQFAPDRSPFGACRPLAWLPQSLTGRGRVRRAISRIVARWHGFDGYFQLYNVPLDRLPLMDYSEKRDLYRPGGILSGDDTIFDLLRRQRIPFHVSDWRRSERHNIEEVCQRLTEGEVCWSYLYLAQLDGVLHAKGTRAPEAAEHLRWYDRQLRRVLEVARERYDGVRMYLFSDHGMTDVVDCCDLRGEVESLGLRFGRDYGAVYDSTMARFWFLGRRAESQIRELLQRNHCGRVLSDEELAEFGCLFADRRYGELFFLLDPGTLICPSDMGQRPLRGMHGYDPRDEDSTALIAATTPCLPPARLDGLLSLMLAEAYRCAGRQAPEFAEAVP